MINQTQYNNLDILFYVGLSPPSLQMCSSDNLNRLLDRSMAGKLSRAKVSIRIIRLRSDISTVHDCLPPLRAYNYGSLLTIRFLPEPSRPSSYPPSRSPWGCSSHDPHTRSSTHPLDHLHGRTHPSRLHRLRSSLQQIHDRFALEVLRDNHWRLTLFSQCTAGSSIPITPLRPGS